MGCVFTGTFSLLCGLIGLIFGGLWGGILGLFIGAIIDAIIMGRRVRSHQHYYQSHDFTAHELYWADYVAKADQNRLLRSEMTYIQEYFRRRVGSERLNAIMVRFRNILNSDIDIHSICADLNSHATINEKLAILHFLFGFSNADGDMRDEEVNAIWEISQMIGLNRSAFEAIRSMFLRNEGYGSYTYGGYGQGGYGGAYGNTGGYTAQPTATDNDYKILEVSPDASNDEVKKAYRAAAKKHHPDKVSHLGEDVRKDAEEKFAKVNEAYERIKKARGIN